MKSYKRQVAAAVVCLLFLGFLGGGAPEATARTQKIVLSVWSYSDELQKFIDRFENTYRGIKVELTVIPYHEYLPKIKAVLDHGENPPDLFAGEYGYLREVVESGYWEDLSAAPYKADVSDMFPYLVRAATDSGGRLRGLSWQVTPGGFLYRRSAARQYLGTDDPEKIGAMLSTPAKFLAAARLLKQKSGGRVGIIAGYADYQHYPCAARTEPFTVKGDTFTVEQPILDYFDLAKTMHDEGLTAEIDIWSTSWFDMINDDTPEFMGYFFPTWGLQYVIKPNALKTMGDWGLCRGPGSFFWGGTWLGICTQSKNKNAAWEFIRFVTLNRDTLEWWASETGDIVSSISVGNKIMKGFTDPVLGGQNSYGFFTREALRINGSSAWAYPPEIQNDMINALGLYAAGTLGKDEALAQWRRNTQDYMSSHVEWKNPAIGTTEGSPGDFTPGKYKEGEFIGSDSRSDGGYVSLSVWSFTDEIKKFAGEFERRYPDIRIEITIVPCEDYENKILAVLRSGRNAPDVFLAEYSNVVDLVESGFYDDLAAAPYKADTSDLIPYIVNVGTDSKGKLRALSWQAVPGGILYRRSAARQYLGTDDPAKIGAMFSTPAKFLAAARLLKQKSGGRVKLIAGYGDYQHFPFALRTKPFVTRGKLNIERCILDYFDLAKTMVDEDLSANIDTWSSPWFENMNRQKPDFMCYVLPTWGLQYVIKPNGRDTAGDWGLCEGPAPYFWGGSWVGIYVNSQYKQEAWEFVKYMTLDPKVQELWAKDTGDFISSRSVINQIKGSFADPQLGGQNHYEFFAREALKIDGRLLAKYDLDIRNFLMGAVHEYASGRMSKDEALEQFKENVKNAFPDVAVE
jgi:multiple sugar transport system substrate-binding protein